MIELLSLLAEDCSSAAKVKRLSIMEGLCRSFSLNLVISLRVAAVGKAMAYYYEIASSADATVGGTKPQSQQATMGNVASPMA
ncbi:MAG: hypothetical protein KME45_12090 [Stenomitos rutilans HA7619-LM2]|nr:hypothetical protein [Stenomitos rutilans HA7619-LM2]